MAIWAALRANQPAKNPCMCCGIQVRIGMTYCWLCALCGGQRRIK